MPQVKHIRMPKTEEEKQLFFDVNLQGTKKICTALENSGIPKLSFLSVQ